MRVMILLLAMLPALSGAHGVYADYDDWGMFLVNNTDHYHYCQIGGYGFDLYPDSRSRSYPPGPWVCQ